MDRIGKFQAITLLFLALFPLRLNASFIEATMGAAVVNDATAAYFNPAALVLIKGPQLISLGSASYLHSEFAGQSTLSITGFTQTGSSITQSSYYLPSGYIGLPIAKRVTFGFAILSNFINKDIDGHSILRYEQSSNSIKNLDLIPAIAIKMNDSISFGAAINFSSASFLLMPTTGFLSLNNPDSESRNESSGRGLGGDVGFLLKPGKSTLIGFNYRSSITYRLNGKSVFEGNPQVISDHYGFTFCTPARSVLSINQLITPSLGIISTVQRIQWSIFKEINIHGLQRK